MPTFNPMNPNWYQGVGPGQDASSAWNAQWLNYGVAYPGPQPGSPFIDDPRTGQPDFPNYLDDPKIAE